MPDSNRYLRVTPTGLLRVDAAAIDPPLTTGVLVSMVKRFMKR
jgi:hypothetical protein